MKNLIVFDVDGTIVDSVKSITRCLTEASLKFGYRIEDITEFVGVLKLSQALIKRGVRKEDVEGILDEYRRCYMDTFTIDTRPVNGARDTMLKLQLTNDLGILTLKDMKLTEKLIKTFFSSVNFKYMVCGDRPIQDKAHGLRLISEESGIEKNRIYYVGDRAEDVRSAIEAGVNAIWVSYGLGKRRDLSTNWKFLEIKEIKDLLSIFRQ
ncbi:MAG: HAD family hydrolase [Thermoplasmatales archaeon]